MLRAHVRPPADPLRALPGVGPSMARDLRDLGVRSVADLGRRNPERLYLALNRLRRARQDRCVLYVFRCAVYAASTPRPEAGLLLWWNWKDRPLSRRHGGVATGADPRERHDRPIHV